MLNYKNYKDSLKEGIIPHLTLIATPHTLAAVIFGTLAKLVKLADDDTHPMRGSYEHFLIFGGAFYAVINTLVAPLAFKLFASNLYRERNWTYGRYILNHLPDTAYHVGLFALFSTSYYLLGTKNLAPEDLTPKRNGEAFMVAGMLTLAAKHIADPFTKQINLNTKDRHELGVRYGSFTAGNIGKRLIRNIPRTVYHSVLLMTFCGLNYAITTHLDMKDEIYAMVTSFYLAGFLAILPIKFMLDYPLLQLPTDKITEAWNLRDTMEHTYAQLNHNRGEDPAEHTYAQVSPKNSRDASSSLLAQGQGTTYGSGDSDSSAQTTTMTLVPPPPPPRNRTDKPARKAPPPPRRSGNTLFLEQDAQYVDTPESNTNKTTSFGPNGSSEA